MTFVIQNSIYVTKYSAMDCVISSLLLCILIKFDTTYYMNLSFSRMKFNEIFDTKQKILSKNGT